MPGEFEPPVRLTDREVEVLKLIAMGLETRVIAVELTISHRTVRKHIENILYKMKASNRAHMVALGFSLGFIDQEKISLDQRSDKVAG